MTKQRRIGIVIEASIAIGAAAGLILGLLHVNPTIAPAAVGIVIGMGIARGAFSGTPAVGKRNRLK